MAPGRQPVCFLTPYRSSKIAIIGFTPESSGRALSSPSTHRNNLGDDGFSISDGSVRKLILKRATEILNMVCFEIISNNCSVKLPHGASVDGHPHGASFDPRRTGLPALHASYHHFTPLAQLFPALKACSCSSISILFSSALYLFLSWINFCSPFLPVPGVIFHSYERSASAHG